MFQRESAALPLSTRTTFHGPCSAFSSAAAVTAFISVKWLIHFVQSHTFNAFGWYRIGYAIAVALALLLAYGLGKPWQHGLAVGLLLLAALGLTIDFFAERRGADYVQGLQVQGWLAAER